MSSPDSRPKAHEPASRWLVPMIAVILTAIAGGVVLWAVQGHQNSGPAVPLAIVNLDAPVTQGTGSDAKTIAAGRQLAAGLSSPDSDDETPLSWQLVDPTTPRRDCGTAPTTGCSPSRRTSPPASPRHRAVTRSRPS